MCPKEICRYIVRVRAYQSFRMRQIWKFYAVRLESSAHGNRKNEIKIKCSEASLYPRDLEENCRRLLYQLISWRSVCN